MPFGYAAGAAVIGAGLSADASRDAARTQAGAANRASDVSQAQFDRLREDQQPFINSGYGANQLLSSLLGINTTRGTGPGTTGVPLNREFNSANGQLVGDKYLPRGTTTKSVGKGYYEVIYNGTRIGTLKPGGKNGKYVADGDALPEQAYETINPGYRAGGMSNGGQDGFGPGASVDGRGFTSAPGFEVADRQSADGSPVPGAAAGPQQGFLTQLFGPEQFRANVDPGYQFRMQQGTQGILNGAASRTGALSGPALKSLIDYNQAAGSQEYGAAFDRFQTQQGNIYQRLLGLTGLGQSAAAGVGAQGVATGGQIGANIIGAGNASAAGQVGAANAFGGALGDLGSLALLRGPLRGSM